MSTFGKKALIWWNYEYSKEGVTRFNHTDSELQLEILKKWYPIGSSCREKEKYTYKVPRAPGGWDWEIIGYIKTIGGYYTIKVKYIGVVDYNYKSKIQGTKIHNRESTFNIFNTELNPEDIKRIKREAKLSKLGF